MTEQFVYQVEKKSNGHFAFLGFIFAKNLQEAEHKLSYLGIPETRIGGTPFKYKRGWYRTWQ
jgi:hypothetical protein